MSSLSKRTLLNEWFYLRLMKYQSLIYLIISSVALYLKHYIISTKIILNVTSFVSFFLNIFNLTTTYLYPSSALAGISENMLHIYHSNTSIMPHNPLITWIFAKHHHGTPYIYQHIRIVTAHAKVFHNLKYSRLSLAPVLALFP